VFYVGQRKVHYVFEDGKEMVECYNMDTNVVVRRVWRKKNTFGIDIGSDVEVGDPEPKQYYESNPEQYIETTDIQECLNVVCFFLI